MLLNEMVKYYHVAQYHAQEFLQSDSAAALSLVHFHESSQVYNEEGFVRQLHYVDQTRLNRFKVWSLLEKTYGTKES
jgi:hypothetical protein